ncbi:MAG: efflux RND transporter periplasmic adaptor subunit [Rhodoplanes sp.]|uniref:efflux RND transporter periplasmic adaptor subunit n=1 Tax=Rhodoplanes sp. TaxID=1968906 RepID=UPI001807919C|nr:efflux RND transporter periplasmic adaptor subunit [Rhodoplanes sp.]NVO17383.1 efflux RND transporter periplasmic adaptor subunit [Rhodoplanes sp.]
MPKILSLLICSLLAAGLGTPATTARAGDALAVSASQAERVGIETSRLEERPASVGLRFPAKVVVPAHRSRLLNAPLGGRIELMAARIDETVKAGQVLAELQSPPLAQAQAEFLVAHNKEQLLKETFEREQSLSPYGAVPRKQVLATGNEYAQARATTAERRQALRHYGMVDTAIDRLIATQALDARLVVVSPVDGVVIETTGVPGQTVEALAPLYRLAQLAPLWIEIQVPAARAGKFAVGAAVVIDDPAITGRVVSIGTSVEATAQTVIVRAEFTESSADLRPGQVVEARIAPMVASEAEWRVQSGALVRRGNDAFVFVQTPTGFVATPVTVQEEMPEFAVVSGTFKGDERIAVRGLAALKGAWQGLGGVE